MTDYPAGAWEKLGRALQLRRMQLGYSQRRRFARARGAPVSEKTIARIERGERTEYEDGTIADIEDLYSLAPGSIKAHLGGGQFILERDPGTVTGLTADEARTVRAFVEFLRRQQADEERRGA